ncbi:hypothetical protein DIZ27_08280 [Streptomyces sp. NWU339]|uniref:hypothetical protein n=1 Tax=Streptomyces sp. NWU339 TaxID=2185284 RepID=UPI000D6730BB|nr:hypothetical protein [Streptomyces sp. NWU339]PWI10865.1 hypothetical protein DIZ27_08280 [Streptomyces sp. NWU339]
MEIARIVALGLATAAGIVYYRRFMAGPSPSRLSSRRAEALGFLPQSGQNTQQAAHDAELERARAAAARGRWEPAAQLLARTREQRDWARRSYYADALGSHRAAQPDSWLHAWEAAAGADDPDVALVRAKATVSLAWHLRGGGWARDTSRDQFAGFHSTLVRAPQENARAAALNPDDPSPYIAEIWAALGLGYSHEDMRRIWKEITARDPHHYGAHCAALQYWCAKWRGSEELAVSFAREAAAKAPLGSLLSALPLITWYEHQNDAAKPADFRAPYLVALVDAALADVGAAPPNHPDRAAVRHLLAYFLTRQSRHHAALEQFRLVDGYVNAMPWRYWDDPAAVYCLWRNRAVKGAGLI